MGDAMTDDLGTLGPASLARPSVVRAVAPGAGHSAVHVRECLDVLPIDAMLGLGLLTAEQHAAGEVVARAWMAAGLHRQSTARYCDGAAGGSEHDDGWRAWADLMARVPARCRMVVVNVCGAGEKPGTMRELGLLQDGLDALVDG